MQDFTGQNISKVLLANVGPTEHSYPRRRIWGLGSSFSRMKAHYVEMENLGRGQHGFPITSPLARKPEQVMNVVRRGNFRGLERAFAPEKCSAYCSLSLCDKTQAPETTTPWGWRWKSKYWAQKPRDVQLLKSKCTNEYTEHWNSRYLKRKSSEDALPPKKVILIYKASFLLSCVKTLIFCSPRMLKWKIFIAVYNHNPQHVGEAAVCCEQEKGSCSQTALGPGLTT